MAGIDHVRIELYEKTKIVHVEERGADLTAPTGHPVCVTDACEETSERAVSSTGSPPPSAGPRSSTEIKEWLVSITNNSDKNLSAYRSQTKPKIQRAPHLLRKNKKYADLFEPEVVAIGPFHHANDRLKPMEEQKIAAAKYFVEQSEHPIELFYNKVRVVASQARECYVNTPRLSDEEFVNMMFFDGCFVLQFIDLFNANKSTNLPMCTHLQGFIVKDLFLLENQIPLIVLKALTSLKNVNLNDFVDKVIGHGTTSTTMSAPKGSKSSKKRGVREEDKDPCHLLDLLRTRFLGPLEVQYHGGGNWNTFRSAMELKEVGIEFKKSRSRELRDVQFDNGCVYSWLSLPQLVVDDLTSSRFLNLIALEMCPDGTSDYGITSYVWLMDRLVDHPEDVKELRSRGILLNALGSDEQVAELFNELAKDLAPDRQAYYKVIQGIDKHYNNKYRVSIVKVVHTHFSSPWTAIAFLAGVFLTILTVIQTVFTVWPRNNN